MLLEVVVCVCVVGLCSSDVRSLFSSLLPFSWLLCGALCTWSFMCVLQRCTMTYYSDVQ